MLTVDALRDEILRDPERLGYGTHLAWSPMAQHWYGDDNTVSELLNAPTTPQVRTVALADATMWMVQHDGARRLQAHAGDAGMVGAVAQGALTVLTSPHIPQLDLRDVRLMTLLNALVPTVFSAGEIGTLVALGTVSASRAEVLWGVGTVVTPTQVANAMGR